jgi:hypothetical protein
MKLIIAMIGLLTLGPAFANGSCNGNLEAQFIAEASNIRLEILNGGKIETSFGIKNIRRFNIHPLCPLDVSLALDAVLSYDGELNLSEGSEISGVLVYNIETGTFKID